MKQYPEIDKALSALEKQMDDLRHEASRLTADLSRRTAKDASDLGSRARGLSHDLYDGASWGLRRADRYARHEGRHLAELARENPGTVSTAGLAAAGLIGLGIWWLLRSGR